MIARRLRPASPSYLLDHQDRAITSARPQSVSRHVGRTRRRNHDGRATRTGGLVKADRIVGGIRRHPSEGAVDLLDQRNASRRVIDARLRQSPGDDHTRPVDTEMPLLPASPPPSSMFRRGPFTALLHESSLARTVVLATCPVRLEFVVRPPLGAGPSPGSGRPNGHCSVQHGPPCGRRRRSTACGPSTTRGCVPRS